MTIYHYSIPAALALVAKLLILYFSQAAKVQNIQTRLFRMAALFSILLSVSELIVLQKPFANSSYYGGIAYYAFSIPMFALLTHLAISIGFENFHARRFLPFHIAFYGYVAPGGASAIHALDRLGRKGLQRLQRDTRSGTAHRAV